MDTDVKFSVMAAMMEKSRGIGYEGLLPWPHIKEDFDYYTTPVHHRKDPAKKNIFIMGRLTWQGATEYCRDLENIIYIIVSGTLSQENQPKGVEIVPDFQASVDLAENFIRTGEIETVWIMGGQRIYTDAVRHSSCEKVYLTRIYKEYPADTYFPEFESDYETISESEIKEEVDGIKLQFFIYKRKHQIKLSG